MDLSPEQAEKIARHAVHASYSAAVGPRVVAGLLAGLDFQRDLNRQLIAALFAARQELAELRRSGGQGGETGGETGEETGAQPPTPIAPPQHPARLLADEPGPAPLPRRVPTASELFWAEQRARYTAIRRVPLHSSHDASHAPMMGADGHCEACETLISLGSL